MKQCSNTICGAENSDNAKFCKVCGTPLTQDNDANNSSDAEQQYRQALFAAYSQGAISLDERRKLLSLQKKLDIPFSAAVEMEKTIKANIQAKKEEAAHIAAEEKRKQEEVRKAEASRIAAEEERKQEETRKAEAARIAAEEKRKQEEVRKAEAARIAAEEKRKQEETRKAEAARIAAEEKRKQEEAHRAEETRIAAEKKRKQEEAHKAEEARIAEQLHLIDDKHKEWDRQKWYKKGGGIFNFLGVIVSIISYLVCFGLFGLWGILLGFVALLFLSLPCVLIIMFILGKINSAWNMFHDNDINENKSKAVQGDGEAQCALGKCFEFGWGVVKDYGEAVKWYQRAVESGYSPAKERLMVLQKKHNK